MRKNPILVIGSHRSGSTWVGKMLSAAPGVGYIREPFNLDISSYNPPFRFQLQYVDENTPEKEQQEILNYLNSFQGFPNQYAFGRLLKFKGVKPYLKTVHEITNLKRRLFERTVYKDPLATLSAEWIYNRLHCDVVVVIRHPAAFVASLKVKDWKYDFNNLWNQKELINGKLKKYKDEIEAHVNAPKDIIEQGILLWNIYHEMIHNYQEKYKDQWIFVRHEDLSLQPVEAFDKIYQQLGLEFTEKVQNRIVASTTSSTTSVLQRDSAKNIKTWKKRLTVEEIEQIKKGTQETWSHFYTEEDWL